MKYHGNNISRYAIDLLFPLWEDKNYTNRVMVFKQWRVKQLYNIYVYEYINTNIIACICYPTLYLQKGVFKVLIYRRLNKMVKIIR
jgi:hypothetical protein